MSSNKLILIGSTVAAVLFACGLFFTMGGLVNTQTTAPLGLYLRVDKPLAYGKVVAFCPPNRPEFQKAREQGIIDSGHCPDNFDCLLLKVAAKYKDKVTVNETGVYVNDNLYPNSKPMFKDGAGRAMPQLVMEGHVLKEKELLLMSDSDNDPFDGRYFGLIDTDQVDSVVEPLLP